jgi:hydroxymethylpyrimidine pyrophosphatase-like HAD family hydrolase
VIRLLILDIEGVLTLPGGGQHPWPLDDLLRLRSRLAAAPFATVLCSGRQAPYGEAMIQALDLFRPIPDPYRAAFRAATGHNFLAWPSMLENGGWFYDPLAKRAIPHPALTPDAVATLRELQRDALEPFAARTGAEMEAGKNFCVSLVPPPARPGSTERAPIDDFRLEVDAAVKAHLGPEWHRQVEIKHSLSAVDVNPKGVSKVSAVRMLLTWSGLRAEEVAGVGDTRADEEWLQVVGHRSAPANGRTALPGLEFYAQGEVARGTLEIVDWLGRIEPGS